MKLPIKYILLYATFFLYSTGGIFSKLAGRQEFLSVRFCLFYGALLITLFFYALLWQKVLRRFSLTVAYANKAVVIPLGMVWGWLIFGEQITWNMILGVAIIVLGVCLVVQSDVG